MNLGMQRQQSKHSAQPRMFYWQWLPRVRSDSFLRWVCLTWGLLSVLLVLSACNSSQQIRQPVPPSGPLSQSTPTPAQLQDRATPLAATVLPVVRPTATALPGPTPTPTAPLAAVVNGQNIMLADYERQVADYEQALLEQGLDPDTLEGQEQLIEVRREVLAGMIDHVLIEERGASLHVGLTDEELQAQVQADIAAGGGQSAFDAWLQSTGQTREDYAEALRQALIEQRVFDVVAGDVPEQAEQVHARHIQVGTEAEAQEIVRRLQAGSDFAELAEEQSLDLATRTSGGDLGWFPRGLVASELEDAAFGLQPGEISGIVALGDGFHVIQVVERERARRLSPENQIALGQAIFEAWLEGLRAAATIERHVGQ